MKFQLFYMLSLLCLALPLCGMETRSLESLCETRPDIEKQSLHAPLWLEFNPFPIASSEDSTYATPRIPETFILTIPGGSVYGPQGIVMSDHALIKELIWPWSPLKYDTSSLDGMPPAEKTDAKIAVLAQEGFRNYYHWLMEVLPKIALLEASGIEYDRLYFSEMDLPFQRETLELMGIDMTKVIEADSQMHIEADRLIVPSFISRSCYTPHWVAQFLRERLMDDSLKHADTPKKIFISRSHASQRRILNECDVEHYLEARGFTTVHLEKLSVKQQMTLFSNATTIVAPHGAGLANILFCEPGTHVIEIFQALEDDTYCYLSQTLGLDYHAIPTTDFSPHGRTLDTVVDWDVLRPKLEVLLLD